MFVMKVVCLNMTCLVESALVSCTKNLSSENKSCIKFSCKTKVVLDYYERNGKCVSASQTCGCGRLLSERNHQAG
jgi:hypothetical protein